MEEAYIPLESQEADTLLKPGDIISLNIIAQGKSYYNLFIAKVKHQVFTQPNTIDSILIDDAFGKLETNFSGDLEDIYNKNPAQVPEIKL